MTLEKKNKSRSEINAAHYAKNRARLAEKARLRKREIAESWRSALAEWDQENAPTDSAVAASGLGEWSVLSAWADPLDALIASEESEDALFLAAL